MDGTDKLNCDGIKCNSLYSLSVRKLSTITVSLPFLGLLVCFITAYIYQYDDVHETHCKVYNVIPSISAITGITPQNYLWRICVALHIGPRILIAQMYKNYLSLKNKMNNNGNNEIFVKVSYWLNVIELSALCGVTYISNKENYPVHEKFFITFMICSLTYMVMMTRTYKLIHPTMTSQQSISYVLKKWLLFTSLGATCSLIFFFIRHRYRCQELAFSWFALSEYIIAASNMAFHLTVAIDFPEEKLAIIKPQLPYFEVRKNKGNVTFKDD